MLGAEFMKEFFWDILPSIVLIIIFVIVLNDFRNNKNLKRNKRYAKESDDINKKEGKRVDYMSIGMWVGVAISIFFIRKFGSIALTYGILCGMLVGKLVGVIVKRNF